MENNIRQIVVAKKCTGCFACMSSCPAGCISVHINAEGFQEPEVDSAQCIECGKCLKKCHVASFDGYGNPLEGYVAESLEEEVYQRSASGGAFAVIAEEALEKNYKIYGASFDKAYRVKHIRVDNVEGIKSLQGSKYVQSDVVDVFRQVQRDLAKCQNVLFSGTPCQIAGLYSYLGGDRDGLVTIDLVCHGVPSPGLWARHLSDGPIRNYGPIDDISFRTKSNYDRYGYVMSVKSDSRIKLIPSVDDFYYYLFINNISLRECCYSCQYACGERISDITLGDCGSVDLYPKFGKRGATSIVLINTEKGREMFRGVKGQLKVEGLDIDKEMQVNRQLYTSAYRPRVRDAFYKEALSAQYCFLAQKYMPRKNVIRKAWDKFKMLVPWRIRRYIKK